ncbi:hypothetical protein D3C73_1257460 [compost metagenome]
MKLLMLPANDMTRSGPKDSITDGKVILLNCCSRVAPSISAASYKSLDMVDRIPITINIVIGNPIQMLTIMTVNFAQNGSVNHGNPPSPK